MTNCFVRGNDKGTVDFYREIDGVEVPLTNEKISKLPNVFIGQQIACDINYPKTEEDVHRHNYWTKRLILEIFKNQKEE